MLNRIFLTLLGLVVSMSFATAESIKVGGAKTASGVVGYIAIEKGYFAAEGLGVVSGDIDIGTIG
jgi:ABC-type nitrate/sulfonate/bicarbonate transport system substrate-binding protein